MKYYIVEIDDQFQEWFIVNTEQGRYLGLELTKLHRKNMVGIDSASFNSRDEALETVYKLKQSRFHFDSLDIKTEIELNRYMLEEALRG